MKLSRSLSGRELAKALRVLGYEMTRQTGSHIRMTCTSPSEHHITVPDHAPLRVGTLAAILSDVAEHHRLSREQLLKKLFG